MEKFIETTFEYLHNCPELPFQEFETSKYLAKGLKELGYKVIESVGGTGVIGILDSGKPGPVLGLRADMDALKFDVDGKEVIYHGCGHDAHSTIVLAAAKMAIEKGIQKGKLYIIFQPAEEIGLGAKAIIESGEIDEVEEMVGIHVRAHYDEKLGQATPMMMHQANGHLNVTVIGENAHGSKPHLGVNAIEAAILAVNSVSYIWNDPLIPHSCKITQFVSGSNSKNTIPDKVDMVFDMRAQDNEIMENMLTKVKGAIENAVTAVGASCAFGDFNGSPAPNYDMELVATVKESIKKVLGGSNDVVITTGAEDFHNYSYIAGKKTAYISLGSGFTPGLHSVSGVFDHSCMENGAKILADLVEKRLS